MTHNLILSKNMKIVKRFRLKIVIFTAVKYRCILHGNVCGGLPLVYTMFPAAKAATFQATMDETG